MLLDAFTDAILPVLSIAGVGYILGRFRDIDAKPLSTITIYVLAPALVFDSLVGTEIGGVTGAKVAFSAVVMTFVMWGVSAAMGRFMGMTDPTR
ncbi:MAG: AEC family transporter, partial [Halobacteria archaeon]|nr:AEC family transporter [Halobacteria archaeon]